MNLKKLLITMLICTMACSISAATTFAEEGVTGESPVVAMIGDDEYSNLKMAFDSAEDGDTIRLVSDWTLTESEVSWDYETTTKCAYLYVAENKSLTFDLNGHTLQTAETISDTVRYDVIANYGTLNIVDTAEMKGKIVANNVTGATSSAGGGFAVVSYGNLAIKDATIDGNNVRSYAVYIEGEGKQLTIDNANISGRGGVAVYNGANAVINSGNFALDVQTQNARDNVIYLYNATATIYGGNFDATHKILNEVQKGGNAVMVQGNSVVEIYGGTFDASETDLHAYGSGGGIGTINVYGGVFNAGLREHNTASVISISGGAFSYDPTDYLADGFVANNYFDGSYYKVTEDKAPTEEINVVFTNPVAEEGCVTYDINLVAAKGMIINRFNSADLAFILTTDEGRIAYEIIDIENDDIVVNSVQENRYEFHFKDKDADVTNDTAEVITIGQVKFNGYGKFDFLVDAEATTNVAHATEVTNNIVDTFIPGGDITKGEGVLNIDDNTITDIEIAVPKRNLTINISFPNSVNENDAAYQSMKIVISGADIEDKEYSLGKGMKSGSYVIEIKDELTLNTKYNIELTGAGYRTARYTVAMTEDKIVNFWNNVMDKKTAVEITESGDELSSATKNFLAGDIVKDNDINLYDLSAVVSYFGKEITKEIEYDKYVEYDLNRDNKIDSKDIAYVLVSWGE